MNIKQPRKHADLIHAWADGADIQLRVFNTWINISYPAFSENEEYRLKPKTYRYRMALMCEHCIDKKYFAVAMNASNATDIECHPCFVKWFTDWKEQEIS